MKRMNHVLNAVVTALVSMGIGGNALADTKAGGHFRAEGLAIARGTVETEYTHTSNMAPLQARIREWQRGRVTLFGKWIDSFETEFDVSERGAFPGFETKAKISIRAGGVNIFYKEHKDGASCDATSFNPSILRNQGIVWLGPLPVFLAADVKLTLAVKANLGFAWGGHNPRAKGSVDGSAYAQVDGGIGILPVRSIAGNLISGKLDYLRGILNFDVSSHFVVSRGNVTLDYTGGQQAIGLRGILFLIRAQWPDWNPMTLWAAF